MLMYPHRWSRLAGPRQISAVSLATYDCGSQSPFHLPPQNTWLHHASFQATSVAQMTVTTHHQDSCTLQSYMAFHPTHHAHSSLLFTFQPFLLSFSTISS